MLSDCTQKMPHEFYHATAPVEFPRRSHVRDINLGTHAPFGPRLRTRCIYNIYTNASQRQRHVALGEPKKNRQP